MTCNLNAFDEGNSYNIPVANTATIDQTGQSASANANVTCWVGDLEVIKVVNWGSATPDQGKTFEICVTGPSFPQGDCKSVGYNGGSAVWENITPGAYTVVETDPGAEWTVVGNNVQVNVPAGGSAQTTITNSTVIPASLGDFVWEDKNQGGIRMRANPRHPWRARDFAPARSGRRVRRGRPTASSARPRPTPTASISSPICCRATTACR